jgi:hypothetical protein
MEPVRRVNCDVHCYLEMQLSLSEINFKKFFFCEITPTRQPRKKSYLKSGLLSQISNMNGQPKIKTGIFVFSKKLKGPTRVGPFNSVTEKSQKTQD